MFFPAGVGGSVQQRHTPHVPHTNIIKRPKTQMFKPTFAAPVFKRIITTVPMNHTRREIKDVTSTFRPLLHFFGSFGGITFQQGIKRISVASIPKRHAIIDSVRSSTDFDSSVRRMYAAGIMVDGSVPITLPTAPPNVSISSATRIAMKKATPEEMKTLTKFMD